MVAHERATHGARLGCARPLAVQGPTAAAGHQARPRRAAALQTTKPGGGHAPAVGTASKGRGKMLATAYFKFSWRGGGKGETCRSNG